MEQDKIRQLKERADEAVSNRLYFAFNDFNRNDDSLNYTWPIDA